MRRGLVSVATCVLALLAGGASACVLFDSEQGSTPSLKELAGASDIVAIVHVDQVAWRTPEEEAEFRRLWETPPAGTPFSYPAPYARLHVHRALKGQIGAGAGVRSSPISCGPSFEAGADYLLFAKRQSGTDDLIPTEGTVRLDEGGDNASMLAELESLLTSTDRADNDHDRQDPRTRNPRLPR